jgi:WD40 repeat protein
MAVQNRKRRRGVVLTPKGLQKLQSGKRKSESENNFGNKYTLEEMRVLSGLYTGTISKVLNCEVGVEKGTIEDLFKAFNLKLDKNDYLRSNTHVNWGEAICASVFYGRTQELATLKQWILDEHCREVAVLGMGGIGKTALSVQLIDEIQANFEYVQWLSLQDAPSIDRVLNNIIQFISDEQETEFNLLESLNDKLSLLIDYLQNRRCLLILDNVESILSSGTRAGQYQPGYEVYGELIRRVGEASHISCLLLTSREKPREVACLEGEALPVRSLQLGGLEIESGLELFRVKGLSAEQDDSKKVIERYAGNPLALKIVATTIQNVFNSSFTEFLQQDISVFGDICSLLEQQYERLSSIERDIMYWLAINREPITFLELQEDFVLPIPQAKLLEGLESLLSRSLVEKNALIFTLQPVVMEYVTNRFVDLVCEEITTRNINLFRRYALMKAMANDSVRKTQICFILKPIINKLLNNFHNKKHIENQLNSILVALRETSPLEQSYTGGNIFNLFCHLETDLTGYDFSYLTIWQANLRDINLYNTNFAHTSIAKSIFVETFGGIFSVVFSPDDTLLATGDTNGEIRLYQVASSKQLLSFQGHDGWVWSVAFSPDGKVLASGSNDCTIKMWDTSSGKCLKTLQGHDGGVRSVAFSFDGRILASSSDDQTVRVWDVDLFQCLNVLQHGCSVWSTAFSPKGYMLASGSDDHTVKLWDINNGSCIQTLQGHTKGVHSISFSPDGHTLASVSHDQTVKLWNVSTNQCIKTLQGHTDLVHSVSFSADGYVLASSSDDQTVRIWDVITGQCVNILQGHNSRVWSISFNKKNILASSSDDQTIKLWDINNVQCIKTLQGYNNGIWSVAVSQDNNIIASGSNDKTVKLWDIANAKCIKTLNGHSSRVTSVVFSSNHHILASGSEDKTVRIWDINTGKCIKILEKHNNRVTSVAFSTDGKFLASGSDDQTVKVWDVDNCQNIQTLVGHLSRVWSVAFSPNSNTLISASHDHTVKLWDATNGQCLKTLQGHTDWVWAVVFSPDGRIFASAGGDQTVKLWDAANGQCLKTLQGHTNCIYSVAFSSDGHVLASGGGDKTVKLWDVETGKCIRTLSGHTKWVWLVVFSSNSKTVVSCSEDETIKIWDVETGSCLRTIIAEGFYKGMNITGVIGLTESQKANLKALGADEY